MKVAVVSESAFSVQGHGVHTAFTETVNGLKKCSISVKENSFQKADVRHIHTVGPYSLAHLLLGSGRKIVSAHVVPESFVGSLVGAKYWLPLARIYLRWFYNQADAVIAVSDETKQDLLGMKVKSPIKVLYNMVDISRYISSPEIKQQARQKLTIDDKRFVVVGNGQVQPRKRIDTFLRLAGELPEVYFIWIGGIPFKRAAADYKKMNSMIENAPENVLVTGVVPHETVKTYFQAADCFIMTSDQETFGLAVVEAAACGLPVILRDISDYDHTFRVDSVMCSEDEFASAIVKLRDDKDHYQKMKLAADRIAHRFDSQTVTKQLLGIYRSDL